MGVGLQLEDASRYHAEHFWVSGKVRIFINTRDPTLLGGDVAGLGAKVGENAVTAATGFFEIVGS